MESLLEFARGPLFRISFAIMLLGLWRILFLDLWGVYKAYQKAGNKKMPWKLIFDRTLQWLFPIKRFTNNRHVYSIFSIIFHIGLLVVPIFLFAHINLWKISLGISWPAIPYWWAFGLTLCVIAAGLYMFISRLASKPMHFMSRGQDYLWLLLLLIPFVTGFTCANLNVSPATYQFFMLVHVLSGDLIFILIPFTKIAHCVLMPFSQVVDAVAWKFPPNTDKEINLTLNKKGVTI